VSFRKPTGLSMLYRVGVMERGILELDWTGEVLRFERRE
jgi:hypothetical protein